jgi:hypothetical protein
MMEIMAILDSLLFFALKLKQMRIVKFNQNLLSQIEAQRQVKRRGNSLKTPPFSIFIKVRGKEGGSVAERIAQKWGATLRLFKKEKEYAIYLLYFHVWDPRRLLTVAQAIQREEGIEAGLIFTAPQHPELVGILPIIPAPASPSAHIQQVFEYLQHQEHIQIPHTSGCIGGRCPGVPGARCAIDSHCFGFS